MTTCERPADSRLPSVDQAHPLSLRRPGGRRLWATLLALGLVAAACGSDGDTAGDATPASDEMAERTTDDMADDDMADDDMADDDMADDDMMTETMDDLMSRIASRSDLTTLDDVIHAANLQGMLHDEGPFTLLAPTNEAFEAYFGEMGMSPEAALGDMDALTALLRAHLLAGTTDTGSLMGSDGQALVTLAGNEVAVSTSGATVMVGDATVVASDATADNGVIHVIDTVLTPPAG